VARPFDPGIDLVVRVHVVHLASPPVLGTVSSVVPTKRCQERESTEVRRRRRRARPAGVAGPVLSLGWNFLDFGFDPADGGGTDAGLVFCGVLFFLMGGVPLLFGLKGLARALWPAPTPPEASGRWRLSGQVRAATSRAQPRIVDARSRRARTGSKARLAPTEPRAGKPAPATAPVDASPVDAPPADATPEDAPTVDGDAGSGGDIVGELERLTDLHRRGALDDDEFERAKDILLGAGEDRP
jgi:hypothetical protein